MGFDPLKSDSTLFVRPRHTRPISILLYVDDLVITGADLREICCVKSQLVASFDMKDLGGERERERDQALSILIYIYVQRSLQRGLELA